MLANHFKLAVRNLNKNKTSSLINLLGFTLGVTACLVIYVITSFELNFDTFHPDRERIYRVVGQSKFSKAAEFGPIGFAPRAVPKALREEVTGLETVASFHNVEMPVTIPNGANGATEPRHFERRNMGNDHAQIVAVEPQYFDIFQYEWLAGNRQVSLNVPNQVVLTEKRARLYFGDLPLSEIMGKEVVYEDSIRTTVSGIVRDWTQNSDFSFTDFISHSTINASSLKQQINLEEWNDVWSASQAFVKLPPGVKHEQVDTQLAAFSQKHFGPDHGTGDFLFIPALQPLSDVHFNADYRDNFSRQAHLPTLYGLMGIAGFILLIAAFNFINLATAQSVKRGREMGMRKVLGSSRKSLIAQFMGETLILTLLAVGFSLIAAPQVLDLIKSFIPEDLTFSVLRPDLFLFLGCMTLLTTLLAGFYPAWVMSSYKPVITLKGPNALIGNQKGSLRKSLIVFQFTFSLVFIIGTIIIGRQLDFIRDKDLGFSSDAVLLLDTRQDEKSAVLAQKLRQLSDVDRVTMQCFAPMDNNYMLTKMIYKGGPSELELEVSAKIGDEQFIPFYELHLLAGRNYLPGDSVRELVINRSFVKALGLQQPENAVGQLLEFNGKNYAIAGVVADFHEQSLHGSIKPTFITHFPDMSKNLGIKLRTRNNQISNLQTTLQSIEAQWASVFPDRKFEYSFLDESIAKVYASDRRTAQVVQGATAVAILISCMGLFGLITFMAEQRSKEIGVRKVLGASVASVVGLLSKEFLSLVLIALVIASPIAWFFMHKWLSNFAYRIDIQWWMFALAGLGAMVIAFLTVGFQSVRAALANPVDSLRSE